MKLDINELTIRQLVTLNEIIKIPLCVHCASELNSENWKVCSRYSSIKRNRENYYKCDGCFKKMHPTHPNVSIISPKIKEPITSCNNCDTILHDNNWLTCLQGSKNKTGHSSYVCTECYLENQRKNRLSKRKIVLNHFGSKCNCCGYSEDTRLIDIDHINNDGHLERSKCLPQHVINQGFPKDKYQLLCRNCNRNKALRKSTTCNCKDPTSRIMELKEFKRSSKYLNIKFQPFETKKCIDCETQLNAENYKLVPNVHPQKYLCIPCRSIRMSQYALRRRIKVLEAYGCKCNHCGHDHPLTLEIDHIFNDGKKERKENKIKCFYKYLIQNNFPKDRYQLLCSNCNYLKYLEVKKQNKKTVSE